MSLQPTIDNINRVLRLIGVTNFSIQKSIDGLGFQIKRKDGTLAGETLSEGEMTLITFLYFMQLVSEGGQDQHQVEGRIVVIDDPISSLTCPEIS